MSITIYDSGLYFGEYEENSLFHVEKSLIYKSLGKNIKTVEFILFHKNNNILFVEAKSSAPNPCKEGDFDEFINEIYKKFLHSIGLYFSVVVKRLNDNRNEMPVCFKEAEYSTVRIKLVLVINRHEIEWLAPIKDALSRKLRVQTKTWRLDLAVLNHELADEYGLLNINNPTVT